jgi:predicted dinucleotide-binding enzyme
MKIGVVGTGNMGRTLGLRWAALGHEILFGSRDIDKARSVAAQSPDFAHGGTFDDAAAFGDVVLYTARDVPPSGLLRERQVLSGKVLIDCNNRVIGKGHDGAGHLAASHAEMLAADVPGARVVKAFNTVAHRVIELSRTQLAPHRVSVFLCSDDSEAKGTVKTLAEELGFVGMDCGTLQDARLVETLFEFVSFQIGAMGLGPFATVSVHVVAEGD